MRHRRAARRSSQATRGSRRNAEGEHELKRFLLTVALALALPGLALAKEPLTARVCGASACRPVAAGTAWHLVPWYGFALAAPAAQPFFTVELRAGSELDSRVVWAPAAGLVWTDARLEAAAAWTRSAGYLRSELERRTRGFRPYPPAAGWRPAPRRLPVTVVKACGPHGCRGVGEAGEAGRRARAEIVRAAPVPAPAGPWFRVVVHQKGRNGFVWSLRYAPGRQAVLIDRMDAAPPFWVPTSAALLPALARATAGIAPYRSR